MKIGFLGKPVKSADYTISHPSVQVFVGLFVCDDELVRHRVIGTRGVRVPPLAHVGQVRKPVGSLLVSRLRDNKVLGNYLYVRSFFVRTASRLASTPRAALRTFQVIGIPAMLSE